MRTRSLPRIAAAALAAGAILVALPAQVAAAADGPTIVLVHGAWERGSSWSLVAERLRGRGYRVIVPELALRRLASDAAQVAAVAREISGPVVLVGHSYGGAVIGNAAGSNVAALVYIAAFAPERGESIVGLDSQSVGSLVAASLVPSPFTEPAPGVDLFINPLLYRPVFAQDVAEPVAAEMAATQRPLTLDALTEPAAPPAWKTIASWYLVAANDLAIPPATERFMARRAKSTTVEIASSHAAHVAHPDAVTDLVVAAAESARPPAAAVAVVSSLRLTPATFRAGRSGATRVTYTLNVAASVRFTVQRSAPGRRVGDRCAAPSASNRASRACTRFAAMRGSFARTRPAGADSFAFTGRLAGRALAPGRYRLVATPAGGEPARTPFRIAR